MKKLNLIVIFDKNIKNVLMCKRKKEPYKGLYNFVGGKVESDDSLNEAYRELDEETNIKNQDVDLIHFMNLVYVKWGIELEGYYGILNKEVEVIEEVNKLEWISIEDDFFDFKYAGEGNVGHILKEIMIDINRK